MQALIGPRMHKDKDFIPSSAQTYEKVRRLFSGLVRAIYRIEVVGADRLPATGPAIVAPNHESFLDAIILGAAISRELRFVAKADLWQSRLLAWMIEGLGAIPIERGRSARDRRAACASPPGRHGTSPLAGQNRLPAVAHHRRRADRSRAQPERPSRGNEADRAVTHCRRSTGLAA